MKILKIIKSSNLKAKVFIFYKIFFIFILLSSSFCWNFEYLSNFNIGMIFIYVNLSALIIAYYVLVNKNDNSYNTSLYKKLQELKYIISNKKLFFISICIISMLVRYLPYQVLSWKINILISVGSTIYVVLSSLLLINLLVILITNKQKGLYVEKYLSNLNKLNAKDMIIMVFLICIICLLKIYIFSPIISLTYDYLSYRIYKWFTTH